MDATLNRWYTICSANGASPVWLPNIIVLVGDGSSVTFYYKEETLKAGYNKQSVGKNLKKFEDAIHPDFTRINQSHIVNLNYVDKILNNIVYLKQPLAWELKLTAAYRSDFKRLIGFGR